MEVLNYGVSYVKIILFLLKQDNQHYYDIMVQEAHVSTANFVTRCFENAEKY